MQLNPFSSLHHLLNVSCYLFLQLKTESTPAPPKREEMYPLPLCAGQLAVVKINPLFPACRRPTRI